MPVHTKGLYLYKRSENVNNKFNCNKILPHHPHPPTGPQSPPSCTVNQDFFFKVASQLLHLMHKGNKNKTAKCQLLHLMRKGNKNKTAKCQLLHLMRKGNKNKTAKQRQAGRGVALCPWYVHLLQSLQSICLICTSLQLGVKVCKQALKM